MRSASPPSQSAAKAASLPTKPSSGGSPAIDGRGQRADHREDGQPAAEAGEAAQVAGAGRVVDDADGEEEGGLEQRVRERHHQPGGGELPAAGADEHHEEAELADRAEGEQQLEVGLPERAVAADQHRGEAQAEQDRPPAGDVGEPGREPGAR